MISFMHFPNSIIMFFYNYILQLGLQEKHQNKHIKNHHCKAKHQYATYISLFFFIWAVKKEKKERKKKNSALSLLPLNNITQH